MAPKIVHTQRLYNAFLETRDDLPGVGVIDIMPGMCLVAWVDGNAIHIIPDQRVDSAATLARVFSSPAAAWDYLSDERNRREWDDAI